MLFRMMILPDSVFAPRAHPRSKIGVHLSLLMKKLSLEDRIDYLNVVAREVLQQKLVAFVVIVLLP